MKNESYEAFVDKFKPKLTTDDCYTPPVIYDALLAWVRKEYKLTEETPILRPFWPGADYQAADYPDGCVVVDNPPFSILSQIIKHYCQRGVRFFLFAPSLTILSTLCGAKQFDVCAIYCDCDVTYENGAVVRTAFVTNMEPGYAARSAPELAMIMKDAEAENLRGHRKELPKYSYPDEVICATNFQRFAHYGIDFRVPRSACDFVRTLDAQRPVGKSIYGAGLLLSARLTAERAAAERAAAERWKLSDRERELIARLGE